MCLSMMLSIWDVWKMIIKTAFIDENISVLSIFHMIRTRNDRLLVIVNQLPTSGDVVILEIAMFLFNLNLLRHDEGAATGLPPAQSVTRRVCSLSCILFIDKVILYYIDKVIINCSLISVLILDVATDWSDHALWLPDRSLWLVKPRVTLETYGVLGDCSLLFTPVHKVLKLQMPDLQVVDMRINFSIGVFHAIKEICSDFGVRHSEEMSLLKPSEMVQRKKEKSRSVKKKERRGSLGSSDTNLSSGSLENGRVSTERQISTGSMGNNVPSSPGSPKSVVSQKSSDFSFSESDSLNPYSTALSPMLANSPNAPNPDALEYIQRPKTIQERSAVNVGCVAFWLCSSITAIGFRYFGCCFQ